VDFLVDAQLPPGLARWLVDQGHSAIHVSDLQMEGSEDSVIWDYALNNNATIVTKDEDFAERTARTTSGPVIVWLRIGNATNSVLLEWLQPRFEPILHLLSDGQRLIEVR
jgi:predicted nuclease of predicted toxin-antitoxin system